jgi:hypothetical protein
LGRVSFTTLKQLKYAAKTIGAKPAGSLFIGLVSLQNQPVLPDRAKQRVQKLVEKLL